MRLDLPRYSSDTQRQAVERAAGRLNGSSPSRLSPGQIDLERRYLEAAAKTIAWVEAESEFIRWAVQNKDAIRKAVAEGKLS